MTEYELSRYFSGKYGNVTYEFNTDWMNSAACTGLDTESFFDDDEHSINMAKKVCNHCPIKQACLKHAVENFENHGVWGGTSPRQRAKIRSKVRATNRMYQLEG